MELKEYHDSLMEEIDSSRQITGASFHQEFFDTYVNYLLENDEILGEPAYTYFEMPLNKRQKVNISGYSYNELDGVLSLIVIDDLDFSDELGTLTTASANRLHTNARNFFAFAKDIASMGEESNEAVALAHSINNRKKSDSEPFYYLSAIKIFVLTDKKLSKNLIKTEEQELQGVKILSQFVGIERIRTLAESRRGKIDLEIDFHKYALIPAIKANETEEYESYLCNINGLTLAKLYNEYGSRLIESNVRSFLQTRGKVNKGIRLTILKEPEKFFAYNNGLTCTAKSIVFENNKITQIVGLQIVNGGQTTASLANVMTNDKKIDELLEVSVPMKLNVIKNPEIEDELVPAISRYANSQNKVSDVDLASNHPFHKKFEELSRKTSTPAADGFSIGTYWYYERAAGQYAQETYKMPAATKKRFLEINPKNQMFKKTDLAKYFNIYNQKPHIASKGGQTAFNNFSQWIIKTWDRDTNIINQDFYKEMIANIILFKKLDTRTKIGAGANGYKANINAYTLSYLYWYIEHELKMKFDYTKIWQRQNVGNSVMKFLDDISYQVRNVLTRVEGNVTEYAKKEIAWEDVKKMVKVTEEYDLSLVTISVVEARENKIEAKKVEKFESNLSDITVVYNKLEEDPNYYINLLSFIDNNSKEFLPKERSIISMLATNKYITEKQCKVVLETIQKAELEGFGL